MPCERGIDYDPCRLLEERKSITRFDELGGGGEIRRKKKVASQVFPKKKVGRWLPEKKKKTLSTYIVGGGETFRGGTT